MEPQFLQIILLIKEKLFLASQDKIIYCILGKLELKLLKDHSFVMVVQYLIMIQFSRDNK